jgi:hypothetical protein
MDGLWFEPAESVLHTYLVNSTTRYEHLAISNGCSMSGWVRIDNKRRCQCIRGGNVEHPHGKKEQYHCGENIVVSIKANPIMLCCSRNALLPMVTSLDKNKSFSLLLLQDSARMNVRLVYTTECCSQHTRQQHKHSYCTFPSPDGDKGKC